MDIHRTRDGQAMDNPINIIFRVTLPNTAFIFSLGYMSQPNPLSKQIGSLRDEISKIRTRRRKDSGALKYILDDVDITTPEEENEIDIPTIEDIDPEESMEKKHKIRAQSERDLRRALEKENTKINNELILAKEQKEEEKREILRQAEEEKRKIEEEKRKIEKEKEKVEEEKRIKNLMIRQQEEEKAEEKRKGGRVKLRGNFVLDNKKFGRMFSASGNKKGSDHMVECRPKSSDCHNKYHWYSKNLQGRYNLSVTNGNFGQLFAAKNDKWKGMHLVETDPSENGGRIDDDKFLWKIFHHEGGFYRILNLKFGQMFASKKFKKGKDHVVLCNPKASDKTSDSYLWRYVDI